MKKINWMVRIQNKAFWLSLIPAVLLLIQVVAAVFGYQLELGELGNRLLAVVNALFAVLAVLGVITDPTTSGMGDSDRVLGAGQTAAVRSGASDSAEKSNKEKQRRAPESAGVRRFVDLRGGL